MLYELITASVPKALHPPAYLTTWQPGVTPLSTWKDVSIAMATYFLVIFSGREIMRCVASCFCPPCPFLPAARRWQAHARDGCQHPIRASARPVAGFSFQPNPPPPNPS